MDSNLQQPSSPIGGALMMAAKGVAQIRLVAREKYPISGSTDWQNDTTNTILTTNSDIIRAHNGNFGSAAVAKVGGPCFLEIDASEVFERIKQETGHELLDEVLTLLVRSRTGRGHIYLAHTEKSIALGNVSQAYVKHGDWSFRAQGQFVVSVSSLHPKTGEPYMLVRDGEIAPIPDWLVDWMVSQKTSGTKVAKDDTFPRDENSRIIHGYFHGWLCSQAGKLRNMGLGGNTLEQALLDLAHENLAPPVDDEKVRQVAQSYDKYPKGTAPLHDVILNQQPDSEMEEPADDFHLVGFEPPKNGDSTLLIFAMGSDAEIAKRLGFNATAVKNGEGMVPPSASVTAIKTGYERVVFIGEHPATGKLKPLLTPGSTIAEFPSNGAFDYDSLASILNDKGDVGVTAFLHDQMCKPEFLKTSLLANKETYDRRARGILSTALNSVGTVDDTRVIIRSSIDNLKTLLVKFGNFPPPLTSISLHGLLGDFVEIAYPTTAACRELLIGSMIPIIGAMFGKKNPCMFGSDVHPGATFYLNIARTSDGKGQALNHAIHALTYLDSPWVTEHCHTGIASGEALVRLAGGGKLALGVGEQNRLAIVVPEMSACFAAQNRESSTLSEMIRNGWDGTKLQNARSDSKKSTIATNYTLGISGSITPEALRECLPAIDWKNGSVNRFLWSVMSGSKKVSRSVGQPDFTAWSLRVNQLYALNHNQNERQVVTYSTEGAKVWDAWVDSLPEYEDGDPMADGMARAKPHALRLANLYAQLDERRLDGWTITLEPVHIRAAIEHLERARASMQWYLDEGNAAGPSQKGYDKQDIRKLFQMAAAAVEDSGAAALTAGDIRKAFSHMTANQRNEMCLEAGFAASKSQVGRGAPTTVWTKVR